MVAYTEEQTEDLAFHALYVILSEGPLADDFDIGLERIVRAHGDGKAAALATAPDARDGARTTFQHFDETHRLTLPRLLEAHQTMQANLVKRKIADPWSLETTTAFAPGEGSVAEGTWEYAQAVKAGAKDSSLFFFHRQASDDHELTSKDGVRAAVTEASGPAAEWSDIDGIVDLWRDPQTDPAYFERVYTNRLVQQTAQAFDSQLFASLARPETEIAEGRRVAMGFDGSRFGDDTGIVITDIASGFQIVLGHWSHPGRKHTDWEVPQDEVEEAIAAAFEKWDVVRFYADPFYWESAVASWEARYGAKVVEPWRTNRPRQMAGAIAAYLTAIRTGELTHDGNPNLLAHIGNARRRDTQLTEQGERLFTISKERPDSPHKIDLAMAAILSWEARRDALSMPEEPQHERAIWDAGGRVMHGSSSGGNSSRDPTHAAW
jgi:phage terminase large subunit-like protein